MEPLPKERSDLQRYRIAGAVAGLNGAAPEGAERPPTLEAATGVTMPQWSRSRRSGATARKKRAA